MSSDQFYYVSIVITSESHLVKSEVLRIDKPVNREDAEEFDTVFTDWVHTCPIPGKQPEFLIPLEDPNAPRIEDEDPAREFENELIKILSTEGRFEFFIPTSREDLDEFPDVVTIAGKPYDWTKSKEMLNG